MDSPAPRLPVASVVSGQKRERASVSPQDSGEGAMEGSVIERVVHRFDDDLPPNERQANLRSMRDVHRLGDVPG